MPRDSVVSAGRLGHTVARAVSFVGAGRYHRTTQHGGGGVAAGEGGVRALPGGLPTFKAVLVQCALQPTRRPKDELHRRIAPPVFPLNR